MFVVTATAEICVTSPCVVDSSLGWVIVANVQVFQSETRPVYSIRLGNKIWFTFKVAALGTDDHRRFKLV